jgi:hypothetical protein
LVGSREASSSLGLSEKKLTAVAHGWAKAEVLGSLAERLPEPRRTELLERALTAAEGIGDGWDKARVLGSLAERLPEKLLERALTAAEGIGDGGAKAEALGSLAARLPETRLSSFLVRVPNHLSTVRRNAGFKLLNKLSTVIDFPDQEIPLSIAETILDVGNRWR